MMAPALIDEARRLAPHSLRLRLHLAALRRDQRGWMAPDFQDVLRKLVVAVRQELGEPLILSSSWPHLRRPHGHWEGELFLRNADVVGSLAYEALIAEGMASAGRRLAGDPLINFVRRVIRRCRDRGVPLYPQAMGSCPTHRVDRIEPEWSKLLGAGNSVQFDCVGIDVWPEASILYLERQALKVAEKLHMRLAYSRSFPGLFTICDDDGVVFDPDAVAGKCADPYEERQRLTAYYDGGPWVPPPDAVVATAPPERSVPEREPMSPALWSLLYTFEKTGNRQLTDWREALRHRPIEEWKATSNPGLWWRLLWMAGAVADDSRQRRAWSALVHAEIVSGIFDCLVPPWAGSTFVQPFRFALEAEGMDLQRELFQLVRHGDLPAVGDAMRAKLLERVEEYGPVLGYLLVAAERTETTVAAVLKANRVRCHLDAEPRPDPEAPAVSTNGRGPLL